MSTTGTINNDDVKRHFEEFGDVREVRDCRNSPNQKFVEFFDLRDSERAYKEAHGRKLLGGVLDIKYGYLQR
jgi:RNA recognition motif-containing protein